MFIMFFICVSTTSLEYIKKNIRVFICVSTTSLEYIKED